MELKEWLIIDIAFTLLFIAFIHFNNWREDDCKKYGGTVVENEIGIFEKCVR